MKIKLYQLKPLHPVVTAAFDKLHWNLADCLEFGWKWLRERKEAIETLMSMGHGRINYAEQEKRFKFWPNDWEAAGFCNPEGIPLLEIGEVVIDLHVSCGIQVGKGGVIERVCIGPDIRVETAELGWLRDNNIDPDDRDARMEFAGKTGREFVTTDDIAYGGELVSLFNL